jgi:Tol biopolymer transport system component
VALNPGSRFGPYDVVARLGGGGMGEVYRAEDTRLGRQVALKVLPDSVAQDADRLARFEREARSLASLNHPNIAQIHGLEERDGVLALVMELVEGETLADRLARGRIRVDDALAVAEQVAEGLAAAHDEGIIHRDLKPANVMIDAAGGRVKVLDFGLAKRLSSGDGTELTTLSGSPAPTERGTLVGTVPYMSPEQVRGQPLDARSDLWALGCLTYELLVGTSPFGRATSAETIAAILGEPPDLDRLPPATPARARLLIGRCLRKDPRHRLHHAADARIELADAMGASDAGASGARSGGARGALPAAPSRWWVPGIGAAVVVVAVGVIALVWSDRERGRRATGADVVTFSVPLPEGTAIGPGEMKTYLAVSPDGGSLVFAGAAARAPLQLHTFTDATTRPLAGTEGASTPVWSPDGRFVAFFAEGRLKKVNVAEGGPPQVLTEASWQGGVSWSRDGVLLFAQRRSDGIAIYRVAAEGGKPSPVTHPDPEREIGHVWPHFLPDGRRFLYLALERSSGESPTRTLYLASLDGGERRVIRGVASRAIYAPPGVLLYVAEGTLVGQPLDLDRAELTGDPVPLSSRLRHFRMTGQAEFSASAGTAHSVLAFHGGPWKSELVAYDRTGTRLRTLGEPSAFDTFAISPDGQRLVVAVLDPANGGHDLWVHDTRTDRTRRLTLHPPDEQSPVWSPDGNRILYRSDVDGPPDLYVRDASGGGAPEAMLKRPTVLEPEDWSRDGQFVLFREFSRATGNDEWLLPLDGEAPRPFLNTRYSEWDGRFSPDGRWVAFVSDESGGAQVYVAPRDDPGARRAVSTRGGISPRWRGDGRELLYVGPGPSVMATSFAGGPKPTIGEPRVLFALGTPVFRGAWDVSPDGQLIVVNHMIEDVSGSPITVVLDWTARLEAR